jgi:hypothetical protein
VSRSVLLSTGIRWIVLLVVVLGLMIGWSATAFAQTSAKGQYANPTSTASGNPAASGNRTGASGTSKGGDDGPSSTSKGGDDGPSGASKGGDDGPSGASKGGDDGPSGASKGGGGGAKAKVLPATGGPLPLSIALGTLVLGSAGLLAFRYVVRR